MKTLLETLEEWERWAQSRKMSDRSVDTYLRELRRIGQSWPDLDLAEITPERIDQYQIERRKLAPSSLRKTISALRHWSRWAIRQGLIINDPTADLDMPKRRAAAPRALNSSQLIALEAWIGQPSDGTHTYQRDRIAIVLMLYAGLRLSETCQLDWNEIDLVERTLWVRDGKGGKDRLVPLHNRLIIVLAEIPSSDRFGRVLRNESGGTLSAKTLRQTFWRRLKAAGIKCSAHQLRHTFASRLINSGADLMVIAELLGHSSLDTTRRYLALEKRKKVEAIQRLPDRF